ncbi:hypothetical protein V494_00416 [Pseudogymnoascus sp. VKM F-4513 (FW-928)]|nr:hypothetical protein V490_00005 [Pseudogymnoascus sp. VKM F-3557]KFY46568.1 hypothetical protein V494_00416 [Pseudogymnoascus sp. VKM F-4513 (FW-928)]
MDHSSIILPFRETETALRTFKPRLGQIFASTPVPSVVLDPKLDIVEVSKSYLSLTSTKREECVGINIYKSISDKNSGAVCVSIRYAIEVAIGSREVSTVDDVHVTSSKYCRVRLIPIFDGEELLFVVLEADANSPSHEKYMAAVDQPSADELCRVLEADKNSPSHANHVVADDQSYTDEMYRVLEADENSSSHANHIVADDQSYTEEMYRVLEADENTSSHGNHIVADDQSYANEMYRVLVNNVTDYAIFMIDTEGRILTWNAGASILKQYKPKEIIGQHFSIFYGDEDVAAKKPQTELEICLREGKVEDEGWRYKKDGSRFWASVIIAPAYRDGQHVGFSKVTRDITERKAAEARVIAAFEEASKLKSDFLATMSHEIRTPMHGMLAAGMLLMDSEMTDEQNELAQIIEESGSLLLGVINDILDYSKLASGSFTAVATTISVWDIISAVVRASQTTLQNGVVLSAESRIEISKNVQSDPLRFRQVLQNIVSNAVKFTEQGSIRIITTISAEDDTSYTMLTEVVDTGIGVSPSAIDTIFTPFTPINSSATKRHKGTGLGLSICKSLVELMGGTIGFRPNQIKGSTCWFTTNLIKTTPRPVALSLIQQSTTKLTDTALANEILVVEDNIINQTIMVKLLKNSGFKNIDVALNGKEGVELMKTASVAYGLILMDINMPVMDGITATEKIREMGLDTPIIAMTANALKGDEELYLARGFNDYVAKPVDRRILLRKLAKWLER